jgi:hypothetical protein
MRVSQPTDKPSAEDTIKRLEAFQRCNGKDLPDPSLKATFQVDRLIPHIRNCDDGTLDDFLRRLNDLLTAYPSPSRQALFEQQLNERLDRECPAASDLVEGLCSAINDGIPVYIQLALEILESPALSTSDFALISQRFFDAYAAYHAPSKITPPDHFSDSFLPVAVQARLKQLESQAKDQ